MQKDIYEAYKKDFQNGWVSIGNICNVDCFFCSQKWNPPGVIKDLRRFLTMEEIKDFTNICSPEKIWFIGSGVHTNNGEFFLHPHAVEILDLFKTKNKLAKESFVFTNGMVDISVEHLKCIKKLNIVFCLSLNSANVSMRKKIMGSSYSKNKNAIDSIERLEKYDLDYFLTMVPLRSILDNGDLENTFKFLKNSKVKEIWIHRPGYTKLTPEPIAKELSIDDKELFEFVSLMRERYKVNVSVSTLSPVEIEKMLSRWLEVFFNKNKDLIKKRKLFLCSECVKDIFPLVLEKLKMQHYEIKVVKSKVFGGNITSAGLLLVEDYICAIDEFLKQGKKRKPECLIISSLSFDINKEDIRMVSYKEIENRCGIKVYTAPW